MVENLSGIIYLLENAKAVRMGIISPEGDAFNAKFDGTTNIGEARLTVDAINKGNQNNIKWDKQMYRLRAALETCMIRRSHGSSIPLHGGPMIGEQLPKELSISTSLDYKDEEWAVVKEWTTRNAKMVINASDHGVIKEDAAAYHENVVGTFWFPLSKCPVFTKRKAVQAFRKSGGNAHTFLQMVFTESEWFRKHVGGQLPDERDIAGILKLFCQFNPRLRYLIKVIADIQLFQGHKILLWIRPPVEQELLSVVYKLLGFHTRTWQADMDQEGREEVQASFQSQDKSSCQILVMSTMVDFAGLNLHGACFNQIFVDQPQSVPMGKQQRRRLRRLGARSNSSIRAIKIVVR